MCSTARNMKMLKSAVSLCPPENSAMQKLSSSSSKFGLVSQHLLLAYLYILYSVVSFCSLIVSNKVKHLFVCHQSTVGLFHLWLCEATWFDFETTNCLWLCEATWFDFETTNCLWLCEPTWFEITNCLWLCEPTWFETTNEALLVTAQNSAVTLSLPNNLCCWF